MLAAEARGWLGPSPRHLRVLGGTGVAVSGSNGNGEHRAGVGTFDSLGLQFWWDLRIANQAVPTIVQVVDLRRDGVALTVALADIEVDLDAHGVLLGVSLGVA